MPYARYFCLKHPVGSVIGNAIYSDGLTISQNVTINTNLNLKIGKGVFLAAGSAIIGGKEIGNRVSIGVNTVVHNKRIDSRNINYRIKEKCFAERVFDLSF